MREREVRMIVSTLLFASLCSTTTTTASALPAVDTLGMEPLVKDTAPAVATSTPTPVPVTDTRAPSMTIVDAFTKETTEATSPIWLWPLFSGGYHSGMGGAGGNASIALTWRATSWFEPELLVGEGAFAGIGGNMFRMFIGSRFTLPLETAQPFAFAGFTHSHATTFAAYLDNPIAASLTLSEAGVVHRQGVEAGLGVTIPVRVPLSGGDTQRFDVVARANAIYLPGFAGLLHGPDHGLEDHVVGLVEIGVGMPLHISD